MARIFSENTEHELSMQTFKEASYSVSVNDEEENHKNVRIATPQSVHDPMFSLPVIPENFFECFKDTRPALEEENTEIIFKELYVPLKLPHEFQLNPNCRVITTNSKFLGEGTFGTYFTAEAKLSNGEVLPVTVKVNHLKKFPIHRVEKECQIWQSLIHKNIAEFYAIYQNGHNVYYLLEYTPHGDLYNHLKKNGKMMEEHARQWYSQIINGVTYMHYLEIAHRDIRPESILLFPNDIVKVSDFSFARKGSLLSNTFCGTLVYGAPEVIAGTQYNTFQADIWSLGILLFVMITGKYPWRKTDSKKDIYTAQVLRTFMKEVDESISKECLDVINNFTNIHPMRPTLFEASARFTWFSGLLEEFLAEDWNQDENRFGEEENGMETESSYLDKLENRETR